MNYNMICDVFRRNRDYEAVLSVLSYPVTGRRKPYYVSGLTQGAEYIFLRSLAEDAASPTEPLVLVFADEKKALGFKEFLSSCGVAGAFFPAAKNFRFLCNRTPPFSVLIYGTLYTCKDRAGAQGGESK